LPILTTLAQSDLILHYYIQLAEYLFCFVCPCLDIYTPPCFTMLRQRFEFFLLVLPAIVSPLSSPSAIGGWTSTSVHHEEISCIVLGGEHHWQGRVGLLDWNCMEVGRHHSTGRNLGLPRDGRNMDASPLSSPPLAPHSFRYRLQYPLLSSLLFCALLFECVFFFSSLSNELEVYYVSYPVRLLLLLKVE
jgi:hypothetical protein